MIDRAIGIAGLGLAVISLVATVMFPNIGKRWAWTGFIAGLLLLGTAVGLVFVPVDAQTPPTIQQNNQGAPNINAPGNGNQFNFGSAQPAPPPSPHVGDESVVVGAVPPGGVGNRSTVVGPTDGSTNTIFNRGGTAIGAGASASPTGVAIGTDARGGVTAPVINAPDNKGIITQGQTGGTNIINQSPPRIPMALYQSGQQIGLVQDFSISPDATQITFKNPRVASGTADGSANVEFQKFVINCPDFAKLINPNAAFNSSVIMGAVTCNVIRNR